MKTVSAFLAAGLVVACCRCSADAAASKSEITSDLKAFVEAKETEARDLTRDLNLNVAPDIWDYFRAARRGDWARTAALEKALRERNAQYEGSQRDDTVSTPVWQPVLDVQLALNAFTEGEPKYTQLFGEEIVRAVPRGAIYFGGTDPGRGLPIALSKSHRDGDPFFTITQNALADGLYLEYLRWLYGKKLVMLTAEDSQKAFADYLADAQRRLKTGKLKPGEDVRIVNNRVQVSGQVAVMSINALLVRMIFDRNADREFFVEESFSLDWMYPHLAPHGPILKLNRNPLPRLTAEVLQRDRAYWGRLVAPMIGDWLSETTTVKEVCAFAETVFGQKNRRGFKGDPKYVDNEYVCKAFSKLRSSVAGVYAWRLNNTQSNDERERLRREADFAFRQAFALCPYSPEAAFRYVNLLVGAGRISDALLLARTASALAKDDKPFQNLVKEVERIAKQQEPR